ncbi:MAG: hypothetical protein F6J94_16290 [Moorea sp. SIO1F2]|nr:hypothetical protein [Moorena sp. SIO1F2]
MEQASCLFHVPAYWWNRHLACFIFQHIGRTGILPVSSSGILVEQASWWNRHLACFIFRHLGGMAILVEQASCLFHVPASWWNRHLACFIPERARCPLY